MPPRRLETKQQHVKAHQPHSNAREHRRRHQATYRSFTLSVEALLTWDQTRTTSHHHSAQGSPAMDQMLPVLYGHMSAMV